MGMEDEVAQGDEIQRWIGSVRHSGRGVRLPEEDRFGNEFPACEDCLWARRIIQRP